MYIDGRLKRLRRKFKALNISPELIRKLNREIGQELREAQNDSWQDGYESGKGVGVGEFKNTNVVAEFEHRKDHLILEAKTKIQAATMGRLSGKRVVIKWRESCDNVYLEIE